jgi:polysaccharide biosynthesis protein PslH
MKVLFVSPLNTGELFGGSVCSDRNYRSIQELVNPENVLLYSLTPIGVPKNFFKLLKYIIRRATNFYMLGLNKTREEEILDLLRDKNISVVFLDSSLLGKLAKKIAKKHPNIKVITFFHNTEIKFLFKCVQTSKNFFYLYWSLFAFLNERLACLYSTRIVALNQRDAKEIRWIYKRKTDFIIPISLTPIEHSSYTVKNTSDSSKKKIGLFVGSYFYPNIYGICWFIENVLPFVDMKLIIVGKLMDSLKIKNTWENLDIEIYGYVDDLSEYYSSADFIIMPIFVGSGMKVKTAEALMYDKYIIGTNEAFEGYLMNNEVCSKCETKDDFIEAINSYRFNETTIGVARGIFDKYYSYQATLSTFDVLIKNI